MSDLGRIYWSRILLRYARAAATLWLLASVIPVLMHPVVPEMPVGPAAVLVQMAAQAVPVAIAPMVAIALFAVAGAIMTARDAQRRDPVRRFTRQQRRDGMVRAGGLCELEAGFRRRCSRPAEHGDHFYPWSRGGATSLQNFVAACARCNRTKGARLPSPSRQRRLEHRRREYFSPSDSPTVGERRSLRNTLLPAA